MPFVDTNVLVYARDTTDPEKQARAADIVRVLWKQRTGRISMQVLQEYYVTVTRKLRPGMPHDRARQDVRHLLAWEPRPVGIGVLEKAWEIEESRGLSWWDSLIVASALDAGATSLLTEDLKNGLVIDSVRIVDPFAAALDPALLHTV